MIFGSNTDPSVQIPSITIAKSWFPSWLVKSFPPLHGWLITFTTFSVAIYPITKPISSRLYVFCGKT
ncbi:hypothetical protein L873DRAFT_1302352 [Choiromyces venosus 120613-1]|uniref:Uncharacterized protein n=1 Tax=Choiromyces venosus 120613-1 TaxID=1336337 RepID=A0A3N4JGV3_9PEZI|nr:hypothetical protein L873DRAFT_1302352 [Choiromyces venosus 120613-1]